MGQLSRYIFEVSKEDYDSLFEAKREELMATGVRNPSHEAVSSATSKAEILRHCRRKTRGEEVTTKLIEDLILEFTGSTDVLDVPLFNEEMVTMWEEQKRHVACIQDKENLPLYSKFSTVKKGHHYLPVYRCARGSNSLESFHSHVVNFIPGKCANAVHFQAFLLDGLSRWNTARKDAVEDLSLVDVRTFDQELTTKFDGLHDKLFGNRLLCKHLPSSEINEYIGMEYLFHQCGKTFDQQFVTSNIDELIDSGFDDEKIDQLGIFGEKDYAEENEDEEEEEATNNESNNKSIDSLGIPGWDKVDRLAQALIDQKGISLSKEASNMIIRLHQQLDPCLLYTSPSPRDKRQSRMPSSA